MYDKEIRILNGLKTGYYQFRDHNHPLAYKDGSVHYHRHVASISVGRWLNSDEHVHHIDGNKLNNNTSNLEVLSNTEHSKKHNPTGEYTSEDRSIAEYTCVTCNIVFHPLRASKTKQYCSDKCFKQSLVKNKEITKELLEELIPTTSWVALGEMFGYSDVGIKKKRAKALGCDIAKAKHRHNAG